MGARLRITSVRRWTKPGDLAAILSSLEENDLLFIDEAHRINKTIEEVLYRRWKSRKLHIIIGKGAGARAISLDLPPFTLVMATTKNEFDFGSPCGRASGRLSSWIITTWAILKKF